MATKTFGHVAGNWSDDTKWEEGSKPAAGDDVVFDSGSANCVVDASTAWIKSMTSTGYAGVLSGSGNIYAGGVNSDNDIAFQANSTWQGMLALYPNSGYNITIYTNGAALYNIWQDRVGGTVNFGDNITMNSTYSLNSGTLRTLDKTWSLPTFTCNSGTTRALYLGSSVVTVTGAGVPWYCTATGWTLDAGTSTIIFNSTSGNVTANMGSKTYYNVEFNNANLTQLTGNNVFNILKRVGVASRVCGISMGSETTVNTTCVFSGNSAINRLLVYGQSMGYASALTLGASATLRTSAGTQYIDVRDMNVSGGAANERDLSAITGLCGDCGGNTGLTLTTSDTQTWNDPDGGNWSDVGNWTGTAISRIPLPQDDVNMGIAFNASKTVTADMPRAGRAVSWLGVSGNVTYSLSAYAISYFGNVTYPASGMTTGGFGNAVDYQSHARTGDLLLTVGMKTFGAMAINCPGCTFKPVGNLVLTGGSYIDHRQGDFDADDYDITIGQYTVANTTSTRKLYMGNGTWTLNATTVATVWNGVAGNATIYPENSTIVISDNGTAIKTFIGGSRTYNNMSITGGGTGAIIISGSNTFNDLTINAPKIVQFTGGTTQNITNPYFNGTSNTNKITLAATSLSIVTPILNKVGGGFVQTEWCDIQGVNVTPANTWYKGAYTRDGECLSFDGTTAGITLAATPIPASGDFAFALRVANRGTSTTTWRAPIGDAGYTSSHITGFIMRTQNTSDLVLYAGPGGGGNEAGMKIVNGINTTNLNKEFHIVISYNSSTHVWSGWVDGVAVTGMTVQYGAPSTFFIGKATLNGPAVWDGTIRDVSIFQKQLTEADAQTLYAGGVVADLYAYYPMTDGSGAYAVDTVAGRNGTLLAGTTWANLAWKNNRAFDALLIGCD